MIHQLADVQTSVIGTGTKIWQFTVVLEGARIGRNCNICSHCFIEGGVVIGDNVTVKNGVHLFSGNRIGDDVFIGPNVAFTNDRNPISGNPNFALEDTIIENGVSIGAGACLLPGIRIEENAIVGAGAVVTKNVRKGVTVAGNPASEIK